MSKTTLLDVNEALADVCRCERQLGRLQRSLENVELCYRKDNPLTESEKDAILSHCEHGGFLCCGSGDLMFEELGLSRHWEQRLSKWGYAEMGCTDDWKPGSKRHAAAIAHLKHFLGR